VNFKILGEALTQIYQNLGSATVFLAGTRIAAGLLAKHPMGLIAKNRSHMRYWCIIYYNLSSYIKIIRSRIR
jgi:hypothetical protein